MIAAVAQRKADAVAGADAVPGKLCRVARDQARRRRVASVTSPSTMAGWLGRAVA